MTTLAQIDFTGTTLAEQAPWNGLIPSYAQAYRVVFTTTDRMFRGSYISHIGKADFTTTFDGNAARTKEEPRVRALVESLKGAGTLFHYNVYAMNLVQNAEYIDLADTDPPSYP